jgi:hypothetical protein
LKAELNFGQVRGSQILLKNWTEPNFGSTSGDTRLRTSSSDEFNDDDDVFNFDPTGDSNVSSPSLSDGP